MQNLVEIIRTVVTEPEVLEDVQALVGELGKNPVVCGDKAGFIANTLLFGYLNHAVAMYEGKYATREDIDAAMRFGCGYPMGPLALLDLIGLDTAYEILETMYQQGRDRLHAPAPILKQMVTAGLLGRKTGRGFYTYEAPDSPVVVADDQTPSADDQPQLQHDIRRVGVVGTGTMATGIVEVFAKAGYDVLFVGRTPGQGRRRASPRSPRTSTSRSSAARPPRSDKADVLGRVTGTTSLDDLRGRRHRGRGDRRGPRDQDHALREPRRDLQARRDPGDHDLLAAGHRAGQGDQPAAGRHRHALLQPGAGHEAGRGRLHRHDRRGRRPRPPGRSATRSTRSRCSCGDRAGFIVNALLFPYLNDAVKMLEAHYATADDIDTAMKQGCALPMGPFELLDVVGNDVSLAIQRELYLEFREPGFAPAPLLEHLVTAGYLGRKTKRGFRDYSAR